jgi:hypothetical protein
MSRTAAFRRIHGRIMLFLDGHENARDSPMLN